MDRKTPILRTDDHPEPLQEVRQGQVIDSRALFGDQRAVTIQHAGERYQLRVTSNNKLILTK